MVKLSGVGCTGLSFMGTLRATQIRHDWKSEYTGGEERGSRGAERRIVRSKEKKDDVEDVTKRTGQRHKG